MEKIFVLELVSAVSKERKFYYFENLSSARFHAKRFLRFPDYYVRVSSSPLRSRARVDRFSVLPYDGKILIK